jgi:hypothetical protein
LRQKYFEKDPKKYLEAVKVTIKEENKALQNTLKTILE